MTTNDVITSIKNDNAFLGHKIIYSLLKNSKPHPVQECIILNALNLNKLWMKIQSCANLLDFLVLFCYTASMPLISRICPAQWQVSDRNHAKFENSAQQLQSNFEFEIIIWLKLKMELLINQKHVSKDYHLS